jgi:hypothetical protein
MRSLEILHQASAEFGKNDVSIPVAFGTHSVCYVDSRLRKQLAPSLRLIPKCFKRQWDLQVTTDYPTAKDFDGLFMVNGIVGGRQRFHRSLLASNDGTERNKALNIVGV